MNPRPSPWQGDALPLSYSRTIFSLHDSKPTQAFLSSLTCLERLRVSIMPAHPGNAIQGFPGRFLGLSVGAILALMSTVSRFLSIAGYIVGAARELARYALGFCWALLLQKVLLAARVLAAESQLAVELNRSGGSKRRRHQFTPACRLLWVVLSKLVESWEAGPPWPLCASPAIRRLRPTPLNARGS